MTYTMTNIIVYTLIYLISEVSENVSSPIGVSIEWHSIYTIWVMCQKASQSLIYPSLLHQTKDNTVYMSSGEEHQAELEIKAPSLRSTLRFIDCLHQLEATLFQHHTWKSWETQRSTQNNKRSHSDTQTKHTKHSNTE